MNLPRMRLRTPGPLDRGSRALILGLSAVVLLGALLARFPFAWKLADGAAQPAAVAASGGGSGIVPRTVVPAPTDDDTSRRPPTVPSRSVMLTKPWPRTPSGVGSKPWPSSATVA